MIDNRERQKGIEAEADRNRQREGLCFIVHIRIISNFTLEPT